jgi:hypothetical protein
MRPIVGPSTLIGWFAVHLLGMRYLASPFVKMNDGRPA